MPKILTHNFLQVGKPYFDRVVMPSLSLTQAEEKLVTKIYSIAGTRIAVHYYGENVAEILSLALSHNEILNEAEGVDTSREVDLTIHAWDSASAARDIPAPWDDASFEKSSTAETVVQAKDFFGVYVGGEESLNFYDPTTKTAYFWTYDVDILPEWVLGAPFRTILHWFLNERDIHLIHGAVVGFDGKSVLLTARSGSGKSTTSLSCLLDGMDYLADDYVAIAAGEEIVAHSIYHSAKVTKHALNFFPEMHDHVWNKQFGEKEKAVIFLANVLPKQVRLSASLDAILIPKITGNTTKVVPTSRLQAMLAIAPTTLLQLPLAEANKIEVFKAMLERTPCYTLELGPEIRRVPEVIKTFLRS